MFHLCKATHLSILVGVCVLSVLLLALVVWVVRGGGPCDALKHCDAFKPLCASYKSEHQFFYSHCDMMRENCMTGTNWKRDAFSHCNVYV